ncbi:MAG: GHKL domain-containing protein [Sphingobacteriales bacterium]|nr:MAG: GHKL domain-containing protein [Sphingobacteriales bacterium]
MLAQVSNNTVTNYTTLDNLFLPVLAFELDGKLKYANKAALNLLDKGPNEDNSYHTFASIFDIHEAVWENMISNLQNNENPDLPLTQHFTLADEKACQVSLHIAYCQEMPEVQCIVNVIACVKKSFPEDYEEKNSSHKILYHNTFYENIAAGIPNGLLLIFDESLNYTFIRENGTSLFDSGEHIIGKKADVLHDEEYLSHLLPLYYEALDGKTSHTEFKSGNDCWYYFSVGPLLHEGNIAGGFAMAFNIDRFKKTELERDKKIEELWYTNNQLKIENGVRKLIERNMYEQKFELEQKNQELEQFAYVASHDLQEPLRMVSSYTQLLGNRYLNQLDDQAKEFISFAVEGATRMQSLITDLLSYSRVGSREMSFEKINLDIILQIVKRNLSVLLEETGAEIECEKYPFVQADASQLVQLFQNLISNAIKFRRQEVKPVIKICFKNIGKFTRVTVEDNGIGMSMEYKDRIFQIFQRLHTRDKYPGTGIGLAICKKIVERHGGQIWVESTLGIGTKFIFTISR